ncbi:MAG: hypothetical protein K2O94_07790 [Clostridiales bacterium]|nr:hypothetical protein [Clostridiales bacterium]
MDIDNEIKKIIDLNCFNLEMDRPNYRILSTTNFATPTTLAAAASDGSEVIINKDFIVSNPQTYMLWLVLSHELRHIWQSKHADFFDSYDNSANMSLKDYNAQKAEIDAWAWAIIMVQGFLGVRPTLEVQLGEEFLKKVYKRIDELLK